MDAETLTVARLDFGAAPPGYGIHVGAFRPRGFGWCRGEHAEWNYLTAAMALAHAWRDYKECHDPPGMEVWQTIARQGSIAQTVWVFSVAGAADGVDWYTESKEARAAAWAWYERRLAAADKMDFGHGVETAAFHRVRKVLLTNNVGGFWPRILTWTDEQVAEVERWLVDSAAEMPEVLRG